MSNRVDYAALARDLGGAAEEPKDPRTFAREEATRVGLDPDLVERVITAESAWNPKAVSPKGARGLMQLMPATAKEFGVTDPFDPEQNIRAGVRKLKGLFDTYQDERLALAAYNAGEGNVKKYGGIPPFKETRDYLTRILGDRPALGPQAPLQGPERPVEGPLVAEADSTEPTVQSAEFDDLPEEQTPGRVAPTPDGFTLPRADVRARANTMEAAQQSFSERLDTILNRMTELGHPMSVKERERSLPRQLAYYLAGTSNADGIRKKSEHQRNLAADLNFVGPDGERLTPSHDDPRQPWNLLRQAASEVGLEWGGDWESLKDNPHVQFPAESIRALLDRPATAPLLSTTAAGSPVTDHGAVPVSQSRVTLTDAIASAFDDDARLTLPNERPRDPRPRRTTDIALPSDSVTNHAPTSAAPADFGALARDLGGVEEAQDYAALAQSLGGQETATPEEPSRTVTGTLKDIFVLTALKAAISVPEAAVGLADIPTAGRIGKFLEGVGFQPGEAKRFLDSFYSDAQKQAFREVEEATGVIDTAVAAITNPSVILHTVLESLPMMGAGGLVGRALAATGRVAPMFAGAAGEGIVAAGATAESLRDQTADGLLTPKQSAIATASGAATSLLGAFGAKFAQRLGIADVETLLIAGTTNRGARRNLTQAIVYGAAAEGFIEELPQSVQEQMMSNIALERPVWDGVDEAAVLGTLAGVVMGGGGQIVDRLAPEQELPPGVIGGEVDTTLPPTLGQPPVRRERFGPGGASGAPPSEPTPPPPTPPPPSDDAPPDAPLTPETDQEREFYAWALAKARGDEVPPLPPLGLPPNFRALARQAQEEAQGAAPPVTGQVIDRAEHEQAATAQQPQPETPPVGTHVILSSPAGRLFGRITERGRVKIGAAMLEGLSDTSVTPGDIVDYDAAWEVNDNPPGIRDLDGNITESDARLADAVSDDGRPAIQPFRAALPPADDVEEDEGTPAPDKPVEEMSDEEVADAVIARVEAKRKAAAPPNSAPFDTDVMHITTPPAADSIVRDGYDLSKHGTGIGGDDYGPGVYLGDYQSDIGGYWRSQLATKNENGEVPTTALKGRVTLQRALVLEDVPRGKQFTRDKREMVQSEAPALLDAFDRKVADGLSANRALGDAAREAGYDGLVLRRRGSDEIIAFDPSRVTFTHRDAKPLDTTEADNGAPPPARTKKPVTPQLPPPGGATYVLPSFVTDPHRPKGAPPASKKGKKKKEKTASGPPPSSYTAIGTNADGVTVYEDARGVRSYVEDGIRITEPVAMRPTRGGMEMSIDTANRAPEFRTEKDTTAKETDGPVVIPGLKEVAISRGAAADQFQSGERIVYQGKLGTVDAPSRAGDDLRIMLDEDNDGSRVHLVDARNVELAPAARPLQGLTHTQLDKLAVDGNKNERDLAAQEREARRREPEPVDGPPVTTPDADLDARRAANKAKRDALAQQLADDLGTTLTSGVDPKHVKLMVGIMRTYIDDGVVEFERAWRLFKSEYPKLAAAAREYFEEAWALLRNETRQVADLDEKAQTDSQENADGGDGQDALDGGRTDRPSDADESAGGPGDGSAPSVAGQQPEAPEGVSDAGAAPRPGKRRPPRRPRGGGRGNEAPGAGATDARGSGVHAPAHVDTADATDDDAVADAHARGQAPRHFVIDSAAVLTEGGAVQKLEDNLAALRLLKELERDGRMATDAEQAVLARYIGWGHTELAPVVDPRGLDKIKDARHKQARQELDQLLTKAELAALGDSTVNAHYSFHELPRAMWSLVERLGFTGGTVLEPAIGTGHFFGTMPANLRTDKRTKLFGVDMEPIAAAIARQLYQGAHIQTSPLQEARLPENYFDLIISNVPFGRLPVFDPKFVSGDKAVMSRSVHNYFFGKAIDLARPGGLIVFVTSRYTMDSQSDVVRQYLDQHAEFLGAFRLPDTAFRKTAGTDVVTDVIVLQKRDPGATTPTSHGQSWTATEEVEVGTDGWNKTPFHVNEYYVAHPKMILGTQTSSGKMARTNEPQYNVEGTMTPATLAGAVAKLPTGVYQPSAAPPRTLAKDAPVDAKQGTFVIEKGKLYTYDQGTLVPSPLKGKALERAKLFIPLRDAYQGVLDAMVNRASDEELAKKQKTLRSTYDKFTKEFGYVSLRENSRVINLDPNGSRVLALEDVEFRRVKKGRPARLIFKGLAPIFTKRTVRPVEEPTRADNPRDALVQSLAWKGQVDLSYMAGLTGKTETEMTAALGEEIYRDPTTRVWTTAEEYLSGDVVTKLAAAEAAAGTDDSYRRNVDALAAVQPAPLTAEDFSAPFGATWIPTEVYERFFQSRGADGRFSIRLINTPQRVNYLAEGWGRDDLLPPGVNLADWAMEALNGELPIIQVKHSDGTKSTDWEATERYRQSLKQLREEWATWWQSTAAVADQLTKIYNAMFNREAARTFDGSNLITPNANPAIELRPWQKNVVWRALQAGNTLLAHAVGAGKTFAMIAIAGEMKRLGLAQKPMIVVPNHLIEQWRRDFLAFYPSARVLVPSKTEFSKANRQRLIARIASNDWDAIILPQSQYLRISVTIETLRTFIAEQEAQLLAEGAEDAGMSVEEFDQLIAEIAAADAAKDKQGAKRAKAVLLGRGAKESTKDIVRALIRMRARMQKRLDQQKKDAPVEFEKLGVDALLIDEAHLFKNLYFASAKNGIVGLRGSDSDRAMDMFLKVRLINQASNNRNVHFATGTPVSNAISELFTMFRYLAQTALDRLGMAGFDSWANSYAEAAAEMEPSPGGGYKERTRLRYWSNLRELSKLFRRFTDVFTTEDLVRSGVLKLPTLKHGRPTVVALDPHPEMGAFMDDLNVRIEALKTGRVDKRVDNHLKITGEASLAAIDLRLVRPEAADDPNGRLRVAAREIAKRYHASQETNGTQLVFLDVGTPKGHDIPPMPNTPTAAAPDTDEDTDEDAEEETTDDLVDEEAEAEEALAYLAGIGADRNLYGELKRLLVEQGIPAGEIAFIHQAKSNDDQHRLFQAVREGQIRVMLATTAKGGVGMNIQDRLVALHHLDVPWRPADMEQREGRILRQGNQNDEVEVLRYVTKNSFDEYRWGLLATKQGFIYKLLRGEVNTGEDIDPAQGDMQVASALASGDPRALEMLNIERDVKGLRARYGNWSRKRQGAQANIDRFVGYLKTSRETLEKTRTAITAAREWEKAPTVTLTKAVGKWYGLDDVSQVFDLKDADSRKALQAALEKLLSTDTIGADAVEIGTAGPFRLMYQRAEMQVAKGGQVAVHLTPYVAVSVENLIHIGATPNFDKTATQPPNLVRSLDSYLKVARLEEHAQKSEEWIARHESDLAADRELIKKPFTQAAELEAKTKELYDLRVALGIEKAANKDDAPVAAAPDAPPDDGSPSNQPRVSKLPVTSPATFPSRGARRTTGGPPVSQKRPAQIIAALQKALGQVPINVGKFRHRARGIYKDQVRAIRVKTAGDLRAIFHEAGHDFERAVLGVDIHNGPWSAELFDLGAATADANATRRDQREEGAAEFFVLYLSDPDAAETSAPEFFREVNLRLEAQPDLRDALRQVRTDLQGYLGLAEADRGRLRIDRDGSEPGLARQAVRDPRGTFTEVKRAVATAMVDDLGALRAAVQTMAEGQPLSAIANGYILARVARGSGGKAEAFLEKGVRRRDGRRLGPSLAQALASVKGRLDVLSDYMVAVHALERWDVKKNPGMTRREAEAIIQETEARGDFADIEKAARLVEEYQNALLDYAVDGGLLSRDQVRQMRAQWDHYVPLQRVVDEERGGAGMAKKFANRRAPIYRAVGSGRDIIDPLESIIKTTVAMVDAVEKNRALQALTEQAGTGRHTARFLEQIPPEMAATQFNLAQVSKDVLQAMQDAGMDDAIPDNFADALDRAVTVFTVKRSPTAEDHVITVVVDGQRQFWQVNDPALYEALVAIGPRDTSRLVQWLEKPAKLLRASATLTPGFIARNPFRDTFVAFLQSRYGFLPVYDTIRGLISQVRGDEDAQLFFSSGIAQATLAWQDRAKRRDVIKQIGRNKAEFMRYVAWHPLDALRALSANLEVATRLGEFKLALDAGGVERGVLARLFHTSGRPAVTDESLMQATFAGRDITTDFARAGTVSREMNRYFAFFNARVQGWVRMSEAVKRDPTGVGLKLASLMAFSAALWFLNADDDEYHELEEWEKHAYWHLKLPGMTRYLRLPKPFEWGYAADLTEAALTYASKGDATRFREMKEAFVGSKPEELVVNLLPTGILPLVEAWANYSSFRDTHIVRPWDLDLPTDLQYSEWTSDTAKLLGKVIPIAPSILDHLIAGYTAGFGRGTVQGVDALLRGTGAVPPKKAPRAAPPSQQWPVVGNFLRDQTFGASSQSLQDLYDIAEAIQRVEKGIDADRKRGDVPSANARLSEARRDLPWARRASITKARQDLKEMAATIRQIYAAPPAMMTPAQKRKRLDAAYERMVGMARRGLGRAPLDADRKDGTQGR